MKTSAIHVRRRLPVILGGAIAIALIVSSLVIAQKIGTNQQLAVATGEAASKTELRPTTPNASIKMAKQPTGDEAEIRKAIGAYADAFNRNDAKTIAALWSPDGMYVLATNVEPTIGRPAIEKMFTEMFALRGKLGLEIDTHSIEFISPSVAVERGSSRLIEKDREPFETNYSAVYVKRDGLWLLDRVVEEAVVAIPSIDNQFAEMAWLIGDWQDQSGEFLIESRCRRTLDGRFLSRSFVASIDGRPVKTGFELIGFDPVSKSVRSWIFDSNGSFAEGAWTRDGSRWFVRQTGVLADGQTTSATNILTKLNDNEFTWQSVHREAGGKILPNTNEIMVIRKQDSK